MTDSLQTEAIDAIEGAATLDALQAVRVAYLGKKGALSERMKTLGAMEPTERKEAGARFNAIKAVIEEALTARQQVLEAQAMEARLQEEAIDVTLPVRPSPQGALHPITRVMEEVTDIFASMGFQVEMGPEIEDDFHNFTALNIPESHPARQMHDTFYLTNPDGGDDLVLRTHTSPVQIRTMQNGRPPFRFVAPGATYRCDSDATHTPMFHQIEGVVIEPGIHMGHLKGCLTTFCKRFFEVDDLPVRFRPSYFPFTEPSAEMDIGCARKDGAIHIGAGGDWLEILGCGMVHPTVLRNCGMDPEAHQGFAFGIGIERLAMLKYGMPDLRAFFDSDIRWLRHYGFPVFAA